MPRRKQADKVDGVEIVFSGVLLAMAVGTAWTSLTGSMEMTVLLGIVTASLAIAMAVSGRFPKNA